MSIRNPLEWAIDSVSNGAVAVENVIEETARPSAGLRPAIARIGLSDLPAVLAKGWADFLASRTDLILLCLFYPVMGLLLARMASGESTIPLLFPLIAGFALVGPVAAIGLYEMSRRRERGLPVSWLDAFRVVQARAFGAILVLAAVLAGIFLVWVAAARLIYGITLGPADPASITEFARDVVFTPAGHTMILLGMGVGFLFAVLVLSISLVAFPMLVDRDVGVGTAVSTSLRAVAANPLTIAAWGLIVAAVLALAAIPLFVGLIVALPVLGHATWHLYRRLVPL